jgi:hypothetical protein
MVDERIKGRALPASHGVPYYSQSAKRVGLPSVVLANKDADLLEWRNELRRCSEASITADTVSKKH